MYEKQFEEIPNITLAFGENPSAETQSNYYIDKLVIQQLKRDDYNRQTVSLWREIASYKNIALSLFTHPPLATSDSILYE